MSTGFPDYLSGFQQPSALYVAAGDVLRVAAASSQANEVITVNYRIWQSNRGVKKGQFTISPNASRAIATQDEVMVEGFLISLSCKAAVATTRGQTFVRAILTDSAFGLGQPSAMLMSDYVTTQSAPGHPNGRVLSPSEGPGNIRALTVTNPGNNADWKVNVPTNARWKLLSGLAQLSTDGTAGSRNFRTEINPIAGINSGSLGVGGIGATVGLLVSFGNGIARQTDVLSSGVVTVSLPIPPVILLGGGSFGVDTTYVGAADNWNTIEFTIEEWLDNV